MRSLFALIVAAAVLAACAAAGGGASGGGKATEAPKPSVAPTTLPSGNPNVDNYGY